MTSPRSASSRLTRPSTRREWLGACAALFGGLLAWRARASAQQLPPGVGVAATPPCDPSTKPTPTRTPAGFRPGAPSRAQLADANERGTRLTLTGSVIGLRCGLIAGATVDVWQADASGATDPSGTRLRGKQLTDAQGRYHVDSIVPGAAAGQAPRVNIRVTVPGKTTLSTILFMPDAIAGQANARDRAFDPLLAMTLIDRAASRVTASFNVILDL